MKVELNTKTYGNIPLKLEVEKGIFVGKNVEVKAKLDLETGEVTFHISEEDLEKIKKDM